MAYSGPVSLNVFAHHLNSKHFYWSGNYSYSERIKDSVIEILYPYILDENDVHLNNLFKKKFEHQSCPNTTPNNRSDTSENVKDIHKNADDSGNHLVLHRISGDRVLYDMPEAAKRPLKHCYLVKQDSYLLDRGLAETLYIWVGSIANEEHVMHGLTRAKVG